MLERSGPLLKGLTLALGFLLFMQVLGLARRWNPVRRTTVPEVPTWAPIVPTNPAVPAAPMAVAGPRRPGPGGPGPALPPEVQARVDRIVQGETLGAVMRPPPMALLGIVGNDVLLRTPTGMSGLVREGGELGGVQVLRIGTNRVLVRENGQEKELTIFEGIGGESLLPQPKQGTP